MSEFNILTLHIIDENYNILYNAYNLPNYYFLNLFKKNNIEEIVNEIQSHIVKNKIYYNQIIKCKSYNLYITLKDNKICTITFTGQFQKILFYNIINKMVNISNNDELKQILNEKYEVDKINEINNNLNDTKYILIENIDKLYNRGEKLENLLLESENLSIETKNFLKKSKKGNKLCCTYL